ncbi:DUF4062 domain-containing protein [Novosphingopyxis baekryungensis]|uniref:DUF4062 domain-containing protein n=1 Tax=Novosphingopyxis baekryungensis TaxID=279369 RepID=UPI0013A5A957|nr:DUF4062 domain-containing protein [Novosphingopyxis baekryungensis]
MFVSSTYYDLKHLRASIEVFIEGLGFEPVLAEVGRIAYDSSQPLDESCYREAENADILVLIVGGRYGSIASSSSSRDEGKMDRDIESITRREFSKAHDADVPVYVMIESGVLSEYQTYIRNKENNDINYAHVDSVEVFKFIEFIYSKQKNNPIQPFEKGGDVENWLRDQWAGMFQELLKQRNENSQITALSSQIKQLDAVNSTLKSYLEEVLQSVSPEKSSTVIERENKSLNDAKIANLLAENLWFRHLRRETEMDLGGHAEVMKTIGSVNEIIPSYEAAYGRESLFGLLNPLEVYEDARRDFNEARKILGLSNVRFTKKFLGELDHLPPAATQ